MRLRQYFHYGEAEACSTRTAAPAQAGLSEAFYKLLGKSGTIIFYDDLEIVSGEEPRLRAVAVSNRVVDQIS